MTRTANKRRFSLFQLVVAESAVPVQVPAVDQEARRRLVAWEYLPLLRARLGFPRGAVAPPHRFEPVRR